MARQDSVFHGSVFSKINESTCFILSLLLVNKNNTPAQRLTLHDCTFNTKQQKSILVKQINPVVRQMTFSNWNFVFVFVRVIFNFLKNALHLSLLMRIFSLIALNYVNIFV